MIIKPKTVTGYLIWLWLLVLVWYWYGKKLVDLCACSKNLNFESFARTNAEALESMMTVGYKADLLVGDSKKTKWQGSFSSSSYNGQSTPDINPPCLCYANIACVPWYFR